MAKTGRPKKEIDKKIFENLCAIFCTEEEIAGIFECSVDTIERWCKREYKCTFADIYKKKTGKGKASLRRTQFKLAEKSPAMAIFLGKNYLGQKDNASDDIDDMTKQLLDSVGRVLGGVDSVIK